MYPMSQKVQKLAFFNEHVLKYLENEKSFYGEIKSIFHHFWRSFSYQKLSQPLECAFKTFISSATQITEEVTYCQNIGTSTSHPSNYILKFLYQIASLRAATLQNYKKSWPLSHTQQIVRLSIITNLHTPSQMLFSDLWSYMKFDCAGNLTTIFNKIPFFYIYKKVK